jgi:hypothetical protein
MSAAEHQWLSTSLGKTVIFSLMGKETLSLVRLVLIKTISGHRQSRNF